MRQELTLDTLKEWDNGRAAVAMKQALRRAVLDLEDRPGEKKVRKVTLTAELTPNMDENGDLDDVEIAFVIATTFPPRRTLPKPAMTDRQGRLIFNDLAPDNPAQTTLDEAGE